MLSTLKLIMLCFVASTISALYVYFWQFNLSNTSNKHKKFISAKKRIGMLYFRNISCQPIHPKALLYNRIFKTGSSSLEEYISATINQTGGFLQKFTTEDWYKTGDSAPYPEIIEHSVSKFNFSAFSAHFFFRANLNISLPFTYINMVREPTQRVVSHYFYMRNTHLRTKNRIEELKASGFWNETIQQCVVDQHRGCESNVMTRFFCGAEKFCSTGNSQAVKKAKYNILHHYAFVGLLEQLNLSINIFKAKLPHFFKTFRVTPRIKMIGNKKPTMSYKTIKFIKSRNKADYKIYRFCKKLFELQVNACKRLHAIS